MNAPPDPVAAQRRGRRIFLLIALVFALPVASAWLIYFAAPELIPQDRTNRGQLVQPAQPVEDLALLDDGSLLVCEFGSSRIQRFGADGKWLGAWGSHGHDPDQLNAPWSIDHDGGSAYILDSGNDRVQVINVP